METLYVICGFLGPLMLIGIFGLIYEFFRIKRDSKRTNPTP